MSVLERSLERLRILLCNVVSRGIVNRVSDAKKMQIVQIGVLSNETMSDVERFQNYGFTSNPLVDSEAIILSVGADRSHPVVIAVDDRRYRINSLASGEVCIYTDEGDKIHLQRGRKIVVETLSCTIDASDDFTVNTKAFAVNAETATITAPETTLAAASNVALQTPAVTMSTSSGDSATMNMTGNIIIDGDVTANGISLNSHTHSGVDSGNSSTGAPQ